MSVLSVIHARRLLLFFAFTLFASATLLFLVQPMIGKIILPQLGGTPGVWNTCMVFFQGVLLIGYGYTHLLTKQPVQRQLIIHGAVLLLPFVALLPQPFSLRGWEPNTESNPFFPLMLQLGIMVGLPFLAVSTTAPLMQKWFGNTDDPAAKDPYFLYGASNFGSMLGLAAYPAVVELLFPVSPGPGDSFWETQVWIWTLGYVIFVALVVGCAMVVWQAIQARSAMPETPEPAPAPPPPPPAPTPTPATAVTAATPKRRGARLDAAKPAPMPETKPETAPEPVVLPNDEITIWRRLRWIGLAAAPTSLMLGVTTYMTTDIAAVAFFWIIPLALYLLTFILVFARWPVVWTGTPHTVMMFVQPCLLLFLVLKMNAPDFPALPWSPGSEFLLHIVAFFGTALMCHGELAKDRPSAKHLTEFFFWMSLGGVLGGLFNALFAPIVFQYGIWEYPVAMVFACLMRSSLVEGEKPLIPGDSSADKQTPIGYALDFGMPILIGVGAYALTAYLLPDNVPFLLQRKFVLAALIVLVLAISLRPVRFGLAVLAIFIAVTAYERKHDVLTYEGRGFFGLLRVRDSDEFRYRMPAIDKNDPILSETKVYRTLIHGGINHGRQIIKYADNSGVENLALTLKKRREPITYFHERNGVAEVYHKLAWPDAQPPAGLINVTGLSDNRLPAAMFGLAFGPDAPWAMLANTQSEPPYAVVGLGTGILACYAKPFQHVDFYEIDPLVRDLSQPAGYYPPWHENRPKWEELKRQLDEKDDKDEKAGKKIIRRSADPTFYFVHDARERGAYLDIIMGDGRLMMKKKTGTDDYKLRAKDKRQGYYHIISLDAFSSDAIPVHLLTEDAVKVYLENLADGGVLVFNTTNRYVRIEGVLAAIAEKLDMECLYCPDYTFDHGDHPDSFSADWIVLRRRLGGVFSRSKIRSGGLSLFQRLQAERKLIAWNGRPISRLGNPEPWSKATEYSKGDIVVYNNEVYRCLAMNRNERPPGDAWRPEPMEQRWQEVNPLPGPVWTDGYSNLLKIMRWR